MRSDFRGDATALLSVGFRAKGNVDVVRYFRFTLAVHTFSTSQISVMSFDQKCFHADQFSLAQVLQRLAIAGFVAES